MPVVTPVQGLVKEICITNHLRADIHEKRLALVLASHSFKSELRGFWNVR